jgi:hypothetical protein
MAPLEPEVPPAGEEIHLPGPSVQPILLTLGITVALLGLTWSIWVVIPGLALTLGVIAWWIADTRRDIAELPAEHH